MIALIGLGLGKIFQEVETSFPLLLIFGFKVQPPEFLRRGRKVKLSNLTKQRLLEGDPEPPGVTIWAKTTVRMGRE